MIVGAVAIAGVALAGLACLLVVYLIYKVRQIHRTLYGTDFAVRTLSRNLSQSLQNRELLTDELELSRPLPALGGWAASPDVLLVIARHVRQSRPDVIVECGSGVSTIALAQAAKLNGHGHIYSVDHDGEFARQTRALLAGYGLSEWATITHVPLREVEIRGERWEWYDPDCLPKTPPIDLLFIDGPPAVPPNLLARYPAGPVLFPRLSARGVVFADDTDRPGEVAILQRWGREFPNLSQRSHFCEKGCQELRVITPPRPGTMTAVGSSSMPAAAMP